MYYKLDYSLIKVYLCISYSLIKMLKYEKNHL